MVYLLIVFLGGLIVLISALFLLSPGKLQPILDSNGSTLSTSISEKVFVNIGGVKQGMFIQGKDTCKPVLLYVHGGPSFPNYFLVDKYAPGLEDFFTVCYWEQRGGGLSYSSNVALESMTLEQLTNDLIEVTNYLRQRFGQEKIYMLAHSGGTTIALLAIQKEPSLYAAYLAMAQITNQAESEKRAYEYMLRIFKENGDKKSVSELNQFNNLEQQSDVMAFHNSVFRDKAMHQLGIGTMHSMKSIFMDVFVPVWTCKAYTLREKVNIWKSKFFFLPKTKLREEILSIDFSERIPELDIPVFFFCGKYDLTVNINLTKEYFSKLNAPHKKFYTFEHSAHSPLFEEPSLFRDIICSDILN